MRSLFLSGLFDFGGIVIITKKEKFYLIFIENVENQSEYILVSEYIDSQTKVSFLHNIDSCMRTFEIQPRNYFHNGTRCPYCSRKNRIRTKDDYIKELKEDNDEYELVSEYINYSTKVQLLHKICGTISWKVPKAKNGCRKCYDENRKPWKTQEQFEIDVKKMKCGSEYTVLGEYKGTLEKILIRHDICGHEWEVTPNAFLTCRKCPLCAGNLPLTTEIFKKRVYDIHEDEYTVLGDYKNSHTKILIRHNLCEHEWDVDPNSFTIAGRKCPICFQSSIIELKLRKILTNEQIIFKNQFSFDDCKKIRCLKFDFAIFDENEKLLFLLEYDGEQHYYPVCFGGISLERATDNYIVTKSNDNIKNKYCEENNIKLVRIPYWEKKNIKNIFLEEYSKSLE